MSAVIITLVSNIFIACLFYTSSVTSICTGRCGATWPDADINCGLCCTQNGDCGGNDNCYADLDITPCLTPSPTICNSRCGTDWNDANSNCGICCTLDGDCPSNGICYADLNLLPCTPLPTKSPTPNPTKYPSITPTKYPTPFPSQFPSKTPTEKPTKYPSITPTKYPTTLPTKFPSKTPTLHPSVAPTFDGETYMPTQKPTLSPSKNPTQNPTENPSENPTENPSKNPTFSPSKKPTQNPTEYVSTMSDNDNGEASFIISISQTEMIYALIGVVAMALMFCFCCIIYCAFCKRKTQVAKKLECSSPKSAVYDGNTPIYDDILITTKI